MIFKNASRTTVFARRTALLLLPIPISIGIVRSASPSGFGNLLTLPLSSDIYVSKNFAPASMLGYIFNNRNIDIQGLRTYGNTWLYYPTNHQQIDDEEEEDPSKALTIENLQPLNMGQFGDDFSFVPLTIKHENTLPSRQLISQSSNIPLSNILEINKKQSTNSGGDVVDEYYIEQDSFNRSVFKEKGDLQLIVDLNLSFENSESVASPTIIDLSQFLSGNASEIPLISVTSPDKNSPTTTFYLKVEKGQPYGNNLNLTLKKTTTNGSSVQGESKVDVSIRNFYLMFSEAPTLPFEDIFSQSENQISSNDNFSGDGRTRIKRIYLDTWTNKTKNTWGNAPAGASAPQANSSDQSQFDFNTSNAFWKSLCSDVYRVGGFIDPSQSSTSTGTTSQSALKDSDSYVKQQKSLHEDFDPREDRLVQPSNTPLKTATLSTTPAPCSGMDNDTKTLLTEFAKPNNGTQTPQTLTNEVHQKIEWHLVPKPIKNLLDTSSSQSNTSKIIQGSFRAWGSGYSSNKDSYDILKEESIKTEHIFDVKIDKETLKSKLINHSKLNNSDNNSASKKLNELKEISSSVQVSIPYSFSLYDPVSNFLSKQRINLSLSLDLRSIYNQSKSFKEFYTYDIGANHSDIGIDYAGKTPYTENATGTKYGLSGTISFGANLYLDLDANLRIQLVTKTKGFVNTKKSVCDWRNRLYKQNTGQNTGQNNCNVGGSTDSDWKYRKHNHIPPFIVLEIHEDPKISSFYFDRRINLQDSSASSAGSSQTSKIETLKAFGDNLDQKDRTVELVKQFDQTNNAEVYFAKLDVTDATSREQQKAVQAQVGQDGTVVATQSSGWLSSSYSWFNYYVPRRHYGELSIEDEDLNELKIHLKGSSALGSIFFQSMHFGTKMTYCRSKSSTSSSTNECADGQKYDSIEKDKENKDLDTKNTHVVEIKFEDIKSATQNSPKIFNFQTIIHRAALDEKGQDTNTFDTNKTKFQVLFKEDDNNALKKSNLSSITSKIPSFSLVGVWYSLELWYDQANKKLCYYTKLRAISSIAAISSNQVKKDLSNAETYKVPGASARAGFELSKIEFKYKKSSAKP